tara:strand:- start:692 stop:1879 length:1188 start_codon:yes stop_codon:yes gene_type:complete
MSQLKINKNIFMIGYIELERDPRVLREAKALVYNGAKVDVIGLKNIDNANINNIDGINYIKINLSRQMRKGSQSYILQYLLFFVKSFLKILSLSRNNHYDIIYVHNIPDFLVFLAFFHKIFFSTKVILDIHDPMTESLRHRMKFRGSSVILKFVEIIERLSWEFSDELITVNKGCKTLIEKQMNYKKDVKIILNMPDRSLFQLDNPIDEVEIFKDKFVLLYTGTLSKWYGLDIAINSLNYLIDSIPNILIYIIGQGPEKNNLNKLIIEKGFSKYVIISDSVPQKQIIPLIYSCSIGISTHLAIDFSKIYFSTKVAEFIYCGKSVVCSRTQGILNYFDDDDLFFFEPGNIVDFSSKVLMVYNDSELVRTKIYNSKQKVKSLDWEIQKNKLFDIISK